MTTHRFQPAVAVARQRGQSTVAFLALGVALALGLVLAAWIVASSLERIKLAGDKITVKGYAEERVLSDAGTWRAIVSVRAPDLPMAYRKLEEDSVRVVKYLESVAGTDTKNLQQGTVNTQTIFEFGPGGVQTGRVLGYELSRQFEFSSQNVAQIGSIATGAARLISEGVAINAMPPQYFFTDLNAVKVRLIGAATRDSLLRAQQFAANSGVTVGPLRSASQGVFQITSPNSTETADYGSYDTSTVEKLVKAVVTVEYAVTRQ
ncbi:MAG: SIMPL domain-containing protein [Proteobacteria bacterium]|nr:SIMPL domain-containing protein [Pseudomonadota bacterium]